MVLDHPVIVSVQAKHCSPPGSASRWCRWQWTNMAFVRTPCMLDSLSKKVAPGLSLGFVVAPLRLRENVMAAVRSGGWTASGFAFAAAQQLMGDGTAAELARLKRIDAQQRQKIAVACLSGLEIQTHGKSAGCPSDRPTRNRTAHAFGNVERKGEDFDSTE
jgi:hypothetical protein